MTTSAHGNLDSETKLKNLMVAAADVFGQLRREGRIAAADNMMTAHYYMSFAKNQYGLIDATEERTDD